MGIKTDVAIIGAGPFGLSIAAHLREAGVTFRIFGEPMWNWRNKMPKGMSMKSDGFASSLSDPQNRLPISKWCADRGIEYRDLGLPVTAENFCAYGQDFQKRLVPSLDTRQVSKLERNGAKFRLVLSDGEEVDAMRVIVATGISSFEWLPPELAVLPKTHVTHSSETQDPSIFKGKRVLVIGRGASSTDVATILLDVGAKVEVVSREPVIFHDPPTPGGRSLWKRMRAPNLGLGPSMRSAVYTFFAGQFRFLPEHIRQRIVRRHLGPAAVWYIREKMERGVPMRSGYEIDSAEVRGSEIVVQFRHADGSKIQVVADHLIAGTGYKVDLARLPFLDPALRKQLVIEGETPKLTGNFESSVPQMYFVGLMSAVTFGPLVRFAVGAGFTARRITRHLARSRVPQTFDVLSKARS